MKRWLAMAALCCLFAAAAPVTAMAAGQWQQAEDGAWQYQREDQSLARGSWEEIEGTWYYFGRDAKMQTGWQKIGNIWYDLTDFGALAQGFRYRSDGGAWYYFDGDGNAHVGWLQDGDRWYWFNGNGIMNTEETREIGGVRYYFRGDGRLCANEYRGFRYLDGGGRLDGARDVLAEDYEGKEIPNVDSGEREAIAEQINDLPKIWLQYFEENDWRFVYCPDKDYYTSAGYSNGGERYYVRYKVDLYAKTLRFARADAIKQGFGEFVYHMAAANADSAGFLDEVRRSTEEIRGFTELPEYYDRDFRIIFAVLFEKYLDESDRQYMKNDLEEIYRIMDETAGGKIYLR